MSQKPSCLRIVLFATALPALWSLASPALALRGDMDCDGGVNNFDIDPFVLALIDPSEYAAEFPHCPITNADVNADGLVNDFDIDAFVAALLHPCPPGLTLCSGQCVYLPEDPQNCGSCGNVCPLGTSCLGGACEPNDP